MVRRGRAIRAQLALGDLDAALAQADAQCRLEAPALSPIVVALARADRCAEALVWLRKGFDASISTRHDVIALVPAVVAVAADPRTPRARCWSRGTRRMSRSMGC